MATNRVKLEDVINEAKTTLEGGNPDRAIAVCNHVFQYYPRCLEASRVLGEAYTEKRLLDEADQLFVFVLSADPQDVLGYVDRGFIAYERGQVDEAIVYYERAVEIDSSISQLREELLRLYHENPGAGRTKIRTTAVGLANRRLHDGFYGQAIEEYSTVLRTTPNRLDVQVGLMEAYWRNRDFPRAEKMATDLLQTHPDLIKANLILWHIYGVRRNQDRAAPYLEKAHALDPLNLIAERLFEDAVGSNDAMRYIDMLGVPAIPAPDTQSDAVGSGQALVPDWATAHSADTDVQLGLRPEAAAPLSNTPSNLGFDMFSLLADTERHVASQEEEARKHEHDEALAGLDELRTHAAGEQGDVFNLFEEVEPSKVDLNASRPTTSGVGAFDLDFEPTGSGDLSMFEEIEPAHLADQTGQHAPLAEPFHLDLDESATKPTQPFHLDLDESATKPAQPFHLDRAELGDTPTQPSQVKPQVPPSQAEFAEPAFAPFQLDESAEASRPFSFDGPASDEFARPASTSFEATPSPSKPSTNDLFDLFGDEEPGFMATAPASLSVTEESFHSPDALPDEAVGPLLPFEPALEPVPLPDEPTPTEAPPSPQPIPPLDEPTQDGAALAPQPVQPAASVLSFDEPVPGHADQPDHAAASDEANLNFLVETPEAATVSDKPTGWPAAPVQATSQENPTPSTNQTATSEHHAFHKRNEQGPLPDFVSASVGSLPQNFELPTPAASFVTSAEPVEAGSTGHSDALHQPQQYQEQENDAMPIKRGPEDDNDVFDWEREELPDYLQAFAMDEGEVARAGLNAPNPVITDVNTPPARIRARDDTGAPGDLPDWLNPVGPSVGSSKAPNFGARGEQIDLGGPTRPGAGSLPNWLDATDLDAAGKGSSPAAFGGQEEFGGLEPFSLTDSDDFGAKATTPPPPPSRQTPPPSPTRSTPPAPPSVNPSSFSPMGMDDDIAPFSLDDNIGGFDALPAPPPANNRRSPGNMPSFEPPAPPPSRSSAPPPASAGSFDFGNDLDMDMDGLMPFSLDADAGMTPPSPPSTPPSRQTPPPAGRGYKPPMPQPSFMPPDDMGDLTPFNLDDNGTPTSPPPSRQTPPPARPAAAPAPFNPFEPGADTSGFEEFEAGAGLSPFRLDEGGPTPTPPPSRQTPPAGGGFGGRPTSSSSNGAQPSPFESNSDAEGGDFDIEPFSLGDDLPSIFQSADDSRNSRGLGLGAMNPLDTLDSQPFRSESRSRRPVEPTPEVAPGEEAPLIGPGLRNRIKQTPLPGSSDEEKGQSLFEKLKQRRQQQDEELARFMPTQPEPTTSASDTTDLTPFDELESLAARPQTQPLVSRPSTAPLSGQSLPLSSKAVPESQPDAFDLSDLGLNQDLDDEAFNLSLDQTLPSSPGQFEGASATSGSSQAFDFEPFDLGNIAEEAKPSQPATQPEPPRPAFDFGERALPTPPVQSPEFEFESATFEDFDFTEPEQTTFEATPIPTDIDKNLLSQPTAFDLGSDHPAPNVQPEAFKFAEQDQAPAINLDRFTASAKPPTAPLSGSAGDAPHFDFDRSEPTAPIFSLPNEPIVPVTFQPPVQAQPPTQAQPPVAQPPVQAQPSFDLSSVAQPPVALPPVQAQPPTPLQTQSPSASGSASGPAATSKVELPVPVAANGSNGSLAATSEPSGDKNMELANDFFDKGDYNQSITYFNTAIKTADAEGLKTVVNRLKQIVATPGSVPRYHRVLGDAYKKQGLFQAALAEYSKALGSAVGARK